MFNKSNIDSQWNYIDNLTSRLSLMWAYAEQEDVQELRLIIQALRSAPKLADAAKRTRFFILVEEMIDCLDEWADAKKLTELTARSVLANS